MSPQNAANATPTPVNHIDAAQALLVQIRALCQQIPNFQFPASKSEARRLVTAASVPQPFVELTNVAVKNSVALSRDGADPDHLRDLRDYAEAYGPMADELEALAFGLRHSVTVAKNEIGSAALATYALAKRLAKRPETADLAPHVEDMQRALGRRGRKRKAQPAPTPATPGPTQASPSTAASPATPVKSS